MEFSDLIYAALVALVSAGGLLTTLAIARSLLFICRPNEILVVSGKRHRSSGGVSNFSVIQAGTHWRVPLLQNVYRLDARLMPIELQVMKVLSNGGIPLDVHAIANVKITSDPQYVYNAVERFLNVPVETIQMTARQTACRTFRAHGSAGSSFVDAMILPRAGRVSKRRRAFRKCKGRLIDL